MSPHKKDKIKKLEAKDFLRIILSIEYIREWIFSQKR